MKIFSLWILFALLMISAGCRSWFEDNRPEPVNPPYQIPENREQIKLYTPDEAVNAAVTAVSLQMAISGIPPVEIRSAKPISLMGGAFRDSLIRMRLAQFRSNASLFYTDHLSEKNVWSLTLKYPDGKIFFSKQYPLDRKPGRK